MVRSSGIEDRIGYAGAGNNLSLAYQRAGQVTEAMSEVLCSYFSNKSLLAQMQRNINPFKELHLSLLVQELVGESMDESSNSNLSDIPISAVIFSNEPLYVQGQNFRVTRISATYGHGEGVVGNQGIATDTILALKGKGDKLYLVEKSCSKPERLAPINGKLEVVPNSAEATEKSALSRAMMQRLYQLAEAIEKHYDQPTDIELVIKNEIIYVVQARPVNRSISKPTYAEIDSDKTRSIEKAKVLVPGCHALTLKNDELVSVDYLEKAQSANCKVVVASHDEPMNSHPVVNLSERGIVCFYTEKKIVKPVKNEVVVVCPQQGLIVVGLHDAFTFKEGYIDHPAPITFSSVPLPQMAIVQPRLSEVIEIFNQIQASRTQEAALKALEPLKLMIEPFKDKIIKAKAYKEPAKELQNLVDDTLKQYKEALARGQSLEILFYAKALRVLFTDSTFSVLNLSALLDQTTKYESEGSGDADMAMLAIIPGLATSVEADWKKFLHAIEPLSSEEKKPLTELLALLGDKRVLWLTFFFAPIYRNMPPSRERQLLHQLVEQMDEESVAFFKSLPKVTKGSSRTLEFFDSDSFINSFKKSSPLAKLIALKSLYQAVDSYDKMLKAIKTDSSKPISVKIAEFKSAIDPYYKLMKRLAENLIGDSKTYLSTSDLEQYCMTLNCALTARINPDGAQSKMEKDDPKLLQPSRSFCVQAAIIGSTNYQRFLPQTYEDFFTLTHQNLLTIISRLQKAYLPNVQQAIPELTTTFSELNKIREIKNSLDGDGNLELQFIGIEQSNDGLVFRYNVPLNIHSSTLQLHYNADGEQQLAVQMIGEGRDRWPAIHFFLFCLHMLKIQPAEALILRRGAIDVRWSVTDPQKLRQAIKLFGLMVERANSGYGEKGPLVQFLVESITIKVWQDNGEAIIKEFIKKNDDKKLCVGFFEKLIYALAKKCSADASDDFVWNMVEHLMVFGEKSNNEFLMKYLKYAIDDIISEDKGAIKKVNAVAAKLQQQQCHKAAFMLAAVSAGISTTELMSGTL